MAIAEAPDSVEPYLVYADWLQSQGDAHGEYIQLMHALEKETDSSRFLARKKRVDRLLADHGATWLNAVKVLSPQWRWGFVRKGRVEAPSLRALLDSRAGRFPRELILTGTGPALQIAVEALPPTLTGLKLEPTYRDDTVNVSSLPSRLVRLALGPARWELPPMIPPALRELRLEAPRAHPSLLPFLTGEPNRLTTLHLTEVPFESGAVFESNAFGSLKRLALVEDLADDTLQWLSKSPLIRQLDHLTVGGPFTDRGLELVLREFARFSRIGEIVLWGGVISRQQRSLARKQLPQMLLLKQPPPATW